MLGTGARVDTSKWSKYKGSSEPHVWFQWVFVLSRDGVGVTVAIPCQGAMQPGVRRLPGIIGGSHFSCSVRSDRQGGQEFYVPCLGKSLCCLLFLVSM